jgi:tetratricopeptide (TPR) repeat protein/transglutaminase-like putative cysteine protease
MPLRLPLAISLLAVLLPITLTQIQGAQTVQPTSPGQTTSAQQPSKDISAKPDSSRPDFSKEAFTIERTFTRITAESDGTGTREVTAEVKMLADAGVKAFGVINFTYTSANETVEFDYVRVRKPDGTVVKTPDYNIQDMPGEVTRTAPLYSDIHEKHVAVKGLSVGDVLEYLVRYRVFKPNVPGQFWYEYSFTKNAIAKDERLEVSVPFEKYIKVVSPEFKPEVQQEGTRRVYRWAHANLEVKQKDPDEPPLRIPPNPDVQITTFTSWEEVGRWYGGLQKDPLAVTPAIQAKAAELTKGLKTDDEKIHALYNFVSLKFHYIGLDFGIGRYQPHAADDVLDNGYGDCKDKHTLLASLLKAEGIEAWPVLIHASRKLDADVPSPAQFNHVITVVPRGGQYIWLDTTPEVAPYGLLMLTLRDKQALVIPADKAPMLMTTPQNPPFLMEQEFSMEGKLGGDGTFTGHAEESFRGDAEVLLRIMFRQVPESQWKEVTQRFSYGMSFGGDVSNVKASAPDDLDHPFGLSYDYVRKNYADWDNHQIIPPLPPTGIEVAKNSKDKKPQEPVLLGGLGKVIYRSRVELPEGYLAAAPARCHLTEPYADYSASTVIEDGIMITNRELEIKSNEVALNDWEGLRNFGRAISDDEYNYIRLNATGAATESTAGAGKKKEEDKNLDVDDAFREGSDALQRRDYKRAQELFEKVIAKNPAYKGAHLNLGGALLAQSQFGDALSELHKEEEVSPDDPRAYQIAAAMISYRGSRDAAIEEWRKLLKVDPQNRTAASVLGQLLYQGGKYSEAVGVLESALKAAPDSPGLLMQLGDAYFKTGQIDKGVVEMRAAIEQKSDDPMTLNNVAYTLAENKVSLDLARQYAEKAANRLDEKAQGSESSSETGLQVTYELSLVWDTLGWVYFQQGDVKRAENFVGPAWLLGEESVVAEHLGEIYEKEGKTQQAARMYEYALAVSSVPTSAMGMGTTPLDVQKAYQTRTDEIRTRYRKLTGKEVPLAEIRRLPNGEWTQTPAEQLRHSREIKLPNQAKLSGSAKFIVALKPGKIESAEYDSGDDSLDVVADKLKAAHYPVEFPPDSGAILVLRVNVSCHPASPCIAALVNPVPGPTPPHFPGAAY